MARLGAHAKIAGGSDWTAAQFSYVILNQRRRRLEGLALANVLVDTLIDKKGSNILLLDIREQAVFSDYFILCNGEHERQLRALTEAVTDAAMDKASLRPRATEGEAESGWVLVDLGTIIIHLFSHERRDYYNLEELWSEAHVVLRMQ